MKLKRFHIYGIKNTQISRPKRAGFFICIIAAFYLALSLCSYIYAPSLYATGMDDDSAFANEMSVDSSGSGRLNSINDNKDWWVVYVSDVGKLRFILEVPDGENFSIKIYDRNLNYLGRSTNRRGYNESKTVNMNYSGPYYAKVYTSGSSSGYYTLHNRVVSGSNRSPRADILSPSENSTVSGKVTISAEAYDRDDPIIRKVRFYIGGRAKHTDYNPENMTPASEWEWDTTSYSNGRHRIKVRAYDYDSSSDTESIYVTVSNNQNHNPELTNARVTPVNGGSSTQFTFYVTYKDADGNPPVTKNISIDETSNDSTHEMTYVSGNYTTGATYKYQSTLPRGQHSFYCYFTDGQGGSDMSSVVNSPNVTNASPEITVTSPASGDSVSGIVDVKVEASDSDGTVGRVEFYVDGGVFPISTSTNITGSNPFNCNYLWLTALYLNGSSHTITIKAIDNEDGTSQVSLPVTIDNNDFISVSHGEGPAAVGDGVIFTGTITSAAKNNRRIYIYSEKAAVSSSVTTNSSGNFTYNWTPTDPGVYNFKFGFTANSFTNGDAVSYVNVVPTLSEIKSLSFSPRPGSRVDMGETVDMRVSVAIQAGAFGILETRITGNGTSKESWEFINSSGSSIRRFDYSIVAPSWPGEYDYNVVARFRPFLFTGPLGLIDQYDAVEREEFSLKVTGTVNTTIEVGEGFSSFALPFAVSNDRISSVFGNNEPRFMYTWDEEISSYRIYPKIDGYETFTALEPGKGYLAYFDNDRNLTFTGTPLHTIKKDLKPGWNFIANSTGIDNLPIPTLTVTEEDVDYPFIWAVRSNILSDTVYELKKNAWVPAKFLKKGRSYFIYAHKEIQLNINAMEGPYFTSFTRDSFAGYIPAEGNMDFSITVPSGATRVGASIHGSGLGDVNLYMYNPQGTLHLTATQGSDTIREAYVNNPQAGTWRMHVESQDEDDLSVTGRIHIDNSGSRYASSTVFFPGQARTGLQRAIFGTFSFGDKAGVEGMTADIGINGATLAFQGLDTPVDGYQALSSCLTYPGLAFVFTGNTGYDSFGDYAGRCSINLIATIPIVGIGGDILQLTKYRKFSKNADTIIDNLYGGKLKVLLKQGERLRDLPKIFTDIDLKGHKINKLFGRIDYEDLVAKYHDNVASLKGFIAERLGRLWYKRYTSAVGILEDSAPLSKEALKTALTEKNLRKDFADGFVGIMDYNPKTWEVKNFKVRNTDDVIYEIGVGGDKVFIDNDVLYFVEEKSFKNAGDWKKQLIDDGKLQKLKDLKRTFETDFNRKVEVIVQGYDSSPPKWLLDDIREAGIKYVELAPK